MMSIGVSILFVLFSCNPIDPGDYLTLNDLIVPVIVINTPQDGDLYGEIVVVEGTVTDIANDEGEAGRVDSFTFDTQQQDIPEEGEVTLNLDGSFSFQFSTTLFNTAITLDFTATDWNGNTSTVTLTLLQDIQISLPTVLPASGTFITGHETVTLLFPQTMDTGTLVVSGDLGAAGTIWATENFPDDKLTLDPSVFWSAGVGRTLIVSLDDYDQPISISYNVFRGVCVSVAGAAGNSGTALAPVDTVPEGIIKVQAVYGTGDVYVSEGTYSMDWLGDVGSRITLVEGISLTGGFSTDWADWAPITHTTKIQDTTDNGGSFANPARIIDAGTGVSIATVVEGFELVGNTGPYSAAIYCSGSSPTFRGNKVVAGADGANETRYGFYIDSSSTPLIEQNTINGPAEGGGATILESYAIYTESSAPTIRQNIIYGGRASNTGGVAKGFQIEDSSDPFSITNNTITGGTALDSRGIEAWNSGDTISIINNVILAGVNYAVGGTNYSLYIRNTSPTIRNNTITAGNPTTKATIAYGMYLRAGASPIIENNIILLVEGTDFYDICGIYEFLTITPSSVKNNDIYWNTGNANLVPYREWSGTIDTDYTTIAAMEADLNGEAASTAGANVDNDPQLDTGYVPTTLSPCAVTTGGIDGDGAAWGYSDDRNGATRTGGAGLGWSMGAFEHDGACQ